MPKWRNGSGRNWWITRPINKMNSLLGKMRPETKKNIKKHSTRKNRANGKALLREQL